MITLRCNTLRRRAFVFLIAGAESAGAQQPHAGHGSAALTREEVAAVARAHVAITAARDSNNVKLAKSGNKTAQAQQQQQAATQQQQAGMSAYQRARAACLEGRGYTVK